MSRKSTEDRKKLTDTFVKALAKNPAPKGKRVIYWDTEVKNFGVQVTDTGHYSFIVQARWGGGSSIRRKVRMATLGAARAMAREMLDVAGKGEDPKKIQEQKDAEREAAEAAEKLRRANTFEKVATEWCRHIRGQRKAREVERDVRRIFLPRWADRPVTSITAADVERVINSMVDTPAQLRNALGYVQRLFRWASRQARFGLAESPAEKLRAQDFVGKKRRGSRVLTDEELRLLWEAVEQLRTERKRDSDGRTPIWFPGDYPYGPLFRLLMLTGQRKSEVAEARWREFDLPKRLWIIPAERMKSDRAHAVPLTDEMIALLEALPRSTSRRNDHDHLFSTTNGHRPVNSFGKVKNRIDDKMALLKADARREAGEPPAVFVYAKAGQKKLEDAQKRADKLGCELVKLDPFVIHDIRRTVRTNLSALPIPYQVSEMMISHAQSELGATYDLYSYEREKRRGFELWGARLHNLLRRSARDNVVEFAARERVGAPQEFDWPDDSWPIGMKPNGELNVVEEDGDAAEPSVENE